MAEEEVTAEVEAVQSVYGDDCVVLQTYPPHLTVHVTPRTADVESKQFVEAVLAIRAGPEYPQEPPCIQILNSKGLDEQRQKHLVNSIQDKARELSSCFMLVALCEEAVERLTSMNHPDGDCPLCLYPLLAKEAGDDILSFMKLMSCFHCFHRECIIRWWNWIQDYQELESCSSSGPSERASRDSLSQQEKKSTGSCPVCRKVFHAKDIEHVLNMVGAHDQLSLNDTKVDENIPESDSERIRREKFKAILKVQQENCGLIGSKETEVLRRGTFLPQPAPPQTPAMSAEETAKLGTTGPKPHFSSNSRGFANQVSNSEHRSTGMRKHGGSNSRKQVKKWIKKESGNAN